MNLFTLGIEEEFQIIDPVTRELISHMHQIVDGGKIISFGAVGYSDYALNKDPVRKQNYIKRHSNEDWSKTNLLSPAWLSRFILKEKPHLEEAIRNANTKYKDVRFTLKT